MTSKEMELRSGVARANIRYYEAEGLLTPRREKNGYRDYSEADLAVLEKIKLLRRLGVSIEELKQLFAGETELSSVLERRLEALRYDRETLCRVEEICGALQSAGETFATLEPEKYLQALDAPETVVPDLPAADALPTVCSIPRRFLARLADYYLCGALIVLPLALAGVNLGAVSGGGLLGQIGAMVLLGLLEPVCLHFFATTPGKALMGLRITHPDGSRLSWQEGFERYLQLLWGGAGFAIPIWSLVQLYRSGSRCMEEEPQPWDDGFAYTMRGSPLRCGLAFAAAAVAFVAGDKAFSGYASLPPNRGALTVEEFAENYNRQADYLNISGKRLDENGRFTWETPENSIVINIGGWEETTLDYTLEDGIITAITYHGETLEDGLLTLPQNTIMLLTSALLWAQEEVPLLAEPRVEMFEEMEQRGWEGYTFTNWGATVSLTVEYTGYRSSGEYLFLEDGKAGIAAFTFTITLEQ